MIIEWDTLECGSLVGEGGAHTYLIAADDQLAEVRLTKWDTPVLASTSFATQVLANTVIFPATRGPGRPPAEPEVAALVEHVKQDCQKYEDGRRVPWAMFNRAWRTWPTFPHPGPDEHWVLYAPPVQPHLHQLQERILHPGDPRHDRARVVVDLPETGEPWRSPDENEWNESRGD